MRRPYHPARRNAPFGASIVRATNRMPDTCSFTKRIRREVLPYAPAPWRRPDSVKIGYEISFTRYF